MLFDHSLFQFMYTKGIWMFFVLGVLWWIGSYIVASAGEKHEKDNDFNDESIILKKRLQYRVSKKLSPPEIIIDFSAMSQDAHTKNQLRDNFQFLIRQYEELEAKKVKFHKEFN